MNELNIIMFLIFQIELFIFVYLKYNFNQIKQKYYSLMINKLENEYKKYSFEL